MMWQPIGGKWKSETQSTGKTATLCKTSKRKNKQSEEKDLQAERRQSLIDKRKDAKNLRMTIKSEIVK